MKTLLVILLSLVNLVSCVSIQNDQIPDHWPKISKRAKIEDFTGSFRNKPREITNNSSGTGRFEDRLLFFVTGSNKNEKDNIFLEIENGEIVFSEINSKGRKTDLKTKSKYKNGSLFVGNYYMREYDALSTSNIHKNHYLFVAEDGSLIGHRRGHAAGRVLFFPGVGIHHQWIFWERLPISQQ